MRVPVSSGIEELQGVVARRGDDDATGAFIDGDGVGLANHRQRPQPARTFGCFDLDDLIGGGESDPHTVATGVGGYAERGTAGQGDARDELEARTRLRLIKGLRSRSASSTAGEIGPRHARDPRSDKRSPSDPVSIPPLSV